MIPHQERNSLDHMSNISFNSEEGGGGRRAERKIVGTNGEVVANQGAAELVEGFSVLEEAGKKRNSGKISRKKANFVFFGVVTITLVATQIESMQFLEETAA